MRKFSILSALMFVATFVWAQPPAQVWSVDKSHSNIGFSATYTLFVDVPGKFLDYDIKFNPTSSDFNNTPVEFVAKVGSITTDNERRDNHLKSDDFFNAEAYPELKFKGTLVKKDAKNYTLNGDLTIRDVTKKVSLPVTYAGTADFGRGLRSGFKIGGTLNRLDYGLKWSSTMPGGDLVVSDEIEIDVTVAMTQPAAQ